MTLLQMTNAINALEVVRPVARVVAITGNQLTVAGFPQDTKLGDRVLLRSISPALHGEIVRLEKSRATVVVDGLAMGVSLGMPVLRESFVGISPDDSWIGRIIDPDGKPLDGRPLFSGPTARDIFGHPPPATERKSLGERLETGLAVTNTLLPIVRGQRIGLFAGSGVGKSTLLGNLAKGVNADVIVVALVGERGREVLEFSRKVLGPEGMARTVIVAATSDRSPNVRRRCALSATTIAEHFRDQGKQVLLLCDSVTRFCEAHREVSTAAGDTTSLRGFPSSTQGVVASLCERAGPGAVGTGDITAIYSVLVAGSDMEEPIADLLRGILDGHIVLAREIAEGGRFPAIDVLRSVSRSLPDAANDMENQLIAEARKVMSVYDKSKIMVQAGLYEAGSDPDLDHAISCHSNLEKFLGCVDGRAVRAHFGSLRQCLNMQPTN